MHYRNSSSILLRKWHGKLEAFLHNSAVPIIGPSQITALDAPLATFVRLAPMLLMLLVIVMFVMALANGTQDMSHLSLLGFAGPTVLPKKSGTEDKKPVNVRQMEQDLKALSRELELAQDELAEGPVSQERGEEIEAKAQEMEDLQAHLDRYNKIAGVNKKGRQVQKVRLPGEDEDGLDRKAIYTTPGHLFVMSRELRHYKEQGMQGWSGKLDIGRRFGKKILLRGEEAREFEKKAYDPATLPVLGVDAVIPIDRDPEIVRFQEPEVLSIRDMLNNTPTASDTIKYVKHIATTRGAGTVARGGLKPFLKIEFSSTTVNVETIAVLSKVTEQDIEDAPRLIAYINGEMNLDVKVEEERQIAWGTGVNELLGLFAPANAIPEFARAAAGDTIIDTIRRMRTDLRKKKVQPNFAAVDPIDWEEVELAKGTDAHYLWGLISDLRGPRIWSLRVVESDAMTNPDTGERRLLLGDGTRGATIYDRNQIQLAVGLMDDDFGRNLRTLRAEERLALAVKRNFAFEFATTAEAES